MMSQLEANSKQDTSRDIILKEARRLFFFQGFVGTSIRDIARASGCTPGNIYSHFRSKEDIFYQALLDEMTSFIDAIKALDNDLNTSPIEQLRTLIHTHMEQTIGVPKGRVLYFEMEMRYLSDSHRAQIVRLRNIYDKILRKIIRRGIDTGVFAEVNEKIVNYAIASTLVRGRLWYSTAGKLSISQTSDAISDLFLNGLLFRPKD